MSGDPFSEVFQDAPMYMVARGPIQRGCLFKSLLCLGLRTEIDRLGIARGGL